MPPAPRAKKRDDFYRDRRRRKVCAFCADKTVVDRLQGGQPPPPLPVRAGQDRAPSQDRHLRRPPARAGRRPQARPPRRPAAVRAPAPPTLSDRRAATVPPARATARTAGGAALPSGRPIEDDRRRSPARRRRRRGRLRVAARPGRGHPHRAAADPRLRAPAARGGRRLAGLRHRDQQRGGRRLPGAARGEPAARHDASSCSPRPARSSAA